MSYAERRNDWPTARRSIYNIPVPDAYGSEEAIADFLTTEWEFEDLVVEDFCLPVWDGEGYLILEAEISFTWGYTDDFRRLHGDLSTPFGFLEIATP